MAKGTKICKVCGKEYEYCKTWNSNDKFRWVDVACSPECGAIYFARIKASRSKDAVISDPEDEVKIEKTEVIDEIDETTDVFDDDEVSEDFVRDARYDDEEAVG